jgi:hypothetical protein
MKKVFCLIALYSVILSGCSLMEDNATHLAFELKRGARSLRWSSKTEMIVSYKPLTGIKQSYFVEINPTVPPASSDTIQYGGIRVGGENIEMTFTSYHQRFVFVPKRLFADKKDTITTIVLRKRNNRIEVAELF